MFGAATVSGTVDDLMRVRRITIFPDIKKWYFAKNNPVGICVTVSLKVRILDQKNSVPSYATRVAVLHYDVAEF